MSEQKSTIINQNPLEATTEEFAAVLERLTFDQIRFVVSRQEFLTDRESAEKIGLKPDTVKKWKYKGAPIDDAVRLMKLDGIALAREIRRRSLAKAMAVKVAGLDKGDDRLRQSVATEIIEWEMGRATQRQEHTGKDGGPIETKVTGDYSPAEHARAIAGLVQALRPDGDQTDGREQDAVDTSVGAPVAGDTEPSG